VETARRYAEIVRPTGLAFIEVKSVAHLAVLDRLAGNAATDMYVPAVVRPADAEPMSDADLERAALLLRACWAAFDRTVQTARGKELRKGPRGGGRELDSIVRHVLEAEAGYAERIGAKLGWGDLGKIPDLSQALSTRRDNVIEGIREVARIGVLPPGPRGGARWPARYFVRRAAYHVVDHTWEIEDRVQF
jgi:hypothetical protein